MNSFLLNRTNQRTIILSIFIQKKFNVAYKALSEDMSVIKSVTHID